MLSEEDVLPGEVAAEMADELETKAGDGKKKSSRDSDIERLERELREKELAVKEKELAGRERTEKAEEKQANAETRRAKYEKVKNAASAAGRKLRAADQAAGNAMASAGKSVTRGVGRGAGLMGGAVIGAGKKANNWAHGKEASTNLILLFWIAVGIQLLDVLFLRFNRSTFFYASIGMYGAMIILAIWFFSREEGHLANPKDIMLFILISGFYVIVPTLLYAVPKLNVIAGTTLFDWVTFFLAILPIWPIYVGIRAKIPFVHKYINFWILFLLFIFIFGVGFNLRPGDVAGIGGRHELVQVGVVFGYLWEKTAEIGTKFWGSIKFLPWAKEVMNQTGIGYYTGMIEQNEQEKVGLYIDNVRLRDQYTYVGEPAVVWADVRGKSFGDEIIASPVCYLDKEGTGVSTTWDPESFSILGEEFSTMSCTFNGLEAGSYLAKVGAWFNFETWAYVTYTFVDIETKRAFDIQGKNINSELDIPRLSRAVYTNGPVMLGMASMVDQPVGIDTLYNAREPVLGVTIDNRWSDGKIEDVKEFIIQVPNDFELVKCDRWEIGEKRPPFMSEDGYDFYSFKKEELGDTRETFQSVTCRLHIKDPAAFLAGAEKVQRTFVAQTKYLYKIEKRQRIYVRE